MSSHRSSPHLVLLAFLFAALLAACGSESGTTGVSPGLDAASADGITADGATAEADGSASGDAAAGDAAGADGQTNPDAAQADAAQADAAQADAAQADAVPGCTKTDPADEVCDGVDNDCDGITDDEAEISAGPSVCDDDNVCNGKEKCVSGKCKPGAYVMCAIGGACFTGSCDPKKGCVKKAKSGKCEDGDVCTVGDYCEGGKCSPGKTAKTCDDGNPCTKDVCDKKLGCSTSGSTCNDNNPCTLDQCDPTTGKCSHAVKLGCKTCSTDSQCDDKNACTTDSCHAGVCLNKPVSGCAGPTDYVPKKLVLSKTKTFPGVPGNVYLDLTVENKGKAYAGSAAGKLAYIFKAASQPMYNAKDPTLGQGHWPGSVLGVPATGTGKSLATAEVAFSVKSANSPAFTAKYLCLHLFNGGDKNVTNNTLCIPNPMPYPEYALNVFTAKPAKGTVFAPKSGATLTMVLTNNGAGEQNTQVHLYASVDGTWDAKDPELGSVYIGKVPTGGKKYPKVVSAGFTQPVMQPHHKFLCAVVGKNYLAKEKNQANNARCTGAVFSNPPDLGASSTTLWTADANGKIVNFPQWGDSFGCRLDLANNANGDAKPTKVRCFIAPDGSAAAQPTKGWWDIHWDTPEVKGKETLKGLASKTQVAITKPMPYGKVKLCAMINWPKNQTEITMTNNQICRPYTIVSMDLFPRPGETKLYTTSSKNPPLTKMKVGASYKVSFQVGNKGNIGSTNKALIAKTSWRVVLSKDQHYDSSDITIFESKGGYSKIAPHGKTKPWYGYVTWYKNDTAKVPAGTPKGSYTVLFVADATNVFKEPEDNNTLVYGTVTVE